MTGRRKVPGRVRAALAKKLQAAFPTFEFTLRDPKSLEDRLVIVPLIFSADDLYPATGAYRSNPIFDCARWEGFVKAAREDGSTYTIRSIYGWTKMSELIKPGELEWHADGEITNPAQGRRAAIAKASGSQQ